MYYKYIKLILKNVQLHFKKNSKPFSQKFFNGKASFEVPYLAQQRGQFPPFPKVRYHFGVRGVQRS